MSHWIIAPIVVPAMTAALIVLFLRHHPSLARVFSVAGALLVLGIAAALLFAASRGPAEMYALGNWPAPFGIVLVLDRLSALMVLLTSVLGVTGLLYALSGWDERGPHFHALWQFQLMGINGAFLTGDLFNLFVFFEILLIASYGLLLHGAGRERLKAGLHYVMINLVGSTLFLIGVGLIYGVTGTLNMADLIQKVPLATGGDAALLKTGGLVLLVVFGLKAALVPIHLWLPSAYANAPAPVAALFAIMTKVGVYSIIRVYTMIFGAGAGESAWLADGWLLPAALVTMAVGAAGVLASRTLARMVAFALLASTGTLMTAVSLFTAKSLTGALYYLIHSTLTSAALFLIVDLIARRRGPHGDMVSVAPRFALAEVLSVLFLLGAIATAGMPPLSGFIGKLLILDGARDSAAAVWIWALILITSLILIMGFARAGSRLFWKSAAQEGFIETPPVPRQSLALAAAALPLAAMVAVTVAAGPVTHYLAGLADQLFDPAAYSAAVLGAAGETP
ncbi:MAG: monovalent cation/H+ antiporter subunit D [Sphingomonadales bacterium]